MNNSYKQAPELDGTQKPSEGSSGFIFGAFKAAKEGPYEDKSIIERSDQEYAYLSFTVGGSFSVLSFEETRKENRVSPPKNRGGGPRGKVTDFSGASRLRFLRCLASIDYLAFEGKIYFITLTYADECPDVYVCKGHLKSFRKRLQRRVGRFPGFWRLGIQKRGFWHLHLLLFLPPSSGSLKELRQFVASSWHEICGRVSLGHLHAGTNVEEIRTRKRAEYVGRYLAKKEVFPEELKTGKVWGVWHEKLLPVRWETTKVSLEDAYKVRRVFRRLQRKKGTGTVHKVQVFVKHENVSRLLKSLQDSNEHPRGARRPLPPQGPSLQGNTSRERSSRAYRAGVSRRNEEN